MVSRKVNKSAVARNRIRRRLYEAIRLMEDQISQPHDIVITVFQDGVLQEPFENLSRQLRRQLVLAGVIGIRRP